MPKRLKNLNEDNLINHNQVLPPLDSLQPVHLVALNRSLQPVPLTRQGGYVTRKSNEHPRTRPLIFSVNINVNANDGATTDIQININSPTPR